MGADTELYLIRHAQSIPNVVPIIGGMRGDAGLTELGRQQAALLEARLSTGEIRADVLYASTLPRAQETAAYVSRALGLPVLPDDDLQELKPGEADGLSVGEWRERYPGPNGRPIDTDFFDPRSPGFPAHPFAPGGESIEAFVERGKRALQRLVERHPGQTVVAVTHGGILRVSFYLAFGVTLRTARYVNAAPANTCLMHWQYRSGDDGEAWTLVTFNDTAHLHHAR